MIKRPRVIPTLLVNNGELVKTKQFHNPRYLGDPINAIKIFNEKEVDELAIMDIGASQSNGSIDYNLLGSMASEAFMPLSYGGGIQSIEDMNTIFSLGYEKVIINTAAVKNPNIIRAASERFGSQSIVISIDYKQTFWGCNCYVKDGKEKVKLSPVTWAKQVEELGAGEIILYNISHDGMKNGYDIPTLSEVAKETTIPVIACGGASQIQDMKDCLDITGVHAVAAGSMFVFFGKLDAVLINYPTEIELLESGIYERC